MAQFVFDAQNEADTVALGQALADLLPDGTTVALNGTLGAGKTRLVQAIASAAGVEPGTAVSPTFVLLQEYHGRRAIYHVDAYRLRDEDEFLELGAEEYLASPGLVFIEWAERVAGALPRERMQIDISETGVTSRRFQLTAHSPALVAVIDKMTAWGQGRVR